MMRHMDISELVSGGQQELRRGTIVLACLLLLRTPGYGYALLDQLHDLGLAVEANTLYPLLRRLESQGVLVSEWNTDEPRPRKFYRTSPDGDRFAAELLADWKRLDGSIRRLDQGEPS
jgi:PadR family transcriptional regulator, regulatory protein PadR